MLRWKSFYMPVRKRKQKGLKVQIFTFFGHFSSDIMAVKRLIIRTLALNLCHMHHSLAFDLVTRYDLACTARTARPGSDQREVALEAQATRCPLSLGNQTAPESSYWTSDGTEQENVNNNNNNKMNVRTFAINLTRCRRRIR